MLIHAPTQSQRAAALAALAVSVPTFRDGLTATTGFLGSLACHPSPQLLLQVVHLSSLSSLSSANCSANLSGFNLSQSKFQQNLQQNLHFTDFKTFWNDVDSESRALPIRRARSRWHATADMARFRSRFLRQQQESKHRNSKWSKSEKSKKSNTKWNTKCNENATY